MFFYFVGVCGLQGPCAKGFVQTVQDSTLSQQTVLKKLHTGNLEASDTNSKTCCRVTRHCLMCKVSDVNACCFCCEPCCPLSVCSTLANDAERAASSTFCVAHMSEKGYTRIEQPVRSHTEYVAPLGQRAATSCTSNVYLLLECSVSSRWPT